MNSFHRSGPAALLLRVALLTLWSLNTAHAQPQDRITSAIKGNQLRHLHGSKHPLAEAANDHGRVDGGMPMQRMILVLTHDDQQDLELRNVIATQRQAGSKAHNVGLTPSQFAAEFGVSENDLGKITAWLALQGFSIDSVANGRHWIEFSGTAALVERAFHTEIHHYLVDNEAHIANSSDISIPEALSPVVAGVLSLHDFRKQPMLTRSTNVSRSPSTGQLAPSPDYTSGRGHHYLSPGDFAKIYNTTPLLVGGTTGTGISIAIPGRTSIALSDVQAFRQMFDLPANDPIVIPNGSTPGVYPSDETESDLDVEWAGAVAPGATIKFVTSESSLTTDGIDLSNAYIVDNKIAPILSISYGLCEAFLGDAGNAFYSALYQQAAAEGISVFVAAGDNGAAGCDPTVSYFAAGNGLAVNGLASTPYNIAVGGTEFNENSNDATYWDAGNGTDLSSALGYMPETTWNETCDPSIDPERCYQTGYYFLFAGSGGASSLYVKPTWQAGIGVPSDGLRDLPDLSLAAAGDHDGYLICVDGSCQTHSSNGQTVIDSATVIGGTSAASPAMAGIMALVEQQNGSYLGLVSDDFYHLAARDNLSKCDSSNLTDPLVPSACVFHDVTAGDNSVPGLSGFDAGTGFDLSTGLGTVDATNLSNGWSYFKMRASVTSLNSSSLQITHGQPFSFTVVAAPATGMGTPSGDFALISDTQGAVFGGTLTNGSFNGSVANLPPGQYSLTAHYGGDSVFLGSDSIPISVQVLPEDEITSIQGWEINFNDALVEIDPKFPPLYGQPIALQVNANGLSGIGSATGDITIVLDGQELATLPLPVGGGGAYLEVDNLPAETGLLPGDHTFTATWSGAGFNAGPPATYALHVAQGSSRTSVEGISDLSNVTDAVPVQLALGAFGDGVIQPTGAIQLMDNDQPLGSPLPLTLSGPLGSGVSQATTTVFLSAGDHDLRAQYDGDSNYFSVLFFNEFGFSLTVLPENIFKGDFESP